MGAFDKYSDCIVCGNPEPRCTCKDSTSNQHDKEIQSFEEWMHWKDRILKWYKLDRNTWEPIKSYELLRDFAEYLLKYEDEE